MENSDFCHWDSCCRKKVRFSHAAHARLRIQRLLRSGYGLAVDSLAAYRCEYCGGWHIGHERCNQQTHGVGRG